MLTWSKFDLNEIVGQNRNQSNRIYEIAELCVKYVQRYVPTKCTFALSQVVLRERQKYFNLENKLFISCKCRLFAIDSY